MIQNNKCCVMTIVRDEAYYLPIWLRHYGRFFKPEDTYILDNDSTDGSTNNLKVNVIKVHNELYFNHQWILDTVQAKQKELLKKYQYVLFCECDEMIAPNPDKYYDLEDYIIKADKPTHRCNGYDLIQGDEEQELDPSKDILLQRKYWFASPGFSKPYLTRIPLSYCAGFHCCDGMPEPDIDLLLLHLHLVDYKYYTARHAWKKAQKWKNDGSLGFHNRMDDKETENNWRNLQKIATVIPANIRRIVI